MRVLIEARVPAAPLCLASTDVAPTANLLADAFDDDPAYVYLFPDGRNRPAGLRDLFRRNLSVHLPFACTFIARDGNRPVATVTLRPPEGIRISPITMLRNGLVPFAVAHGARAVRRLFALKHAYDALERQAAGGRPHWHVHMMVVDRALQGRGLGSQLLVSVLEHAIGARAGERHPIVLTTHKPRNVTFYRRAGFEVVDERQITQGRNRYAVWSMSRPTG